MVDTDLVRAVRGLAMEAVGKVFGDEELEHRGQREQLIHTRRRQVKIMRKKLTEKKSNFLGW